MLDGVSWGLVNCDMDPGKLDVVESRGDYFTLRTFRYLRRQPLVAVCDFQQRWLDLLALYVFMSFVGSNALANRPFSVQAAPSFLRFLFIAVMASRSSANQSLSVQTIFSCP